MRKTTRLSACCFVLTASILGGCTHDQSQNRSGGSYGYTDRQNQSGGQYQDGQVQYGRVQNSAPQGYSNNSFDDNGVAPPPNNGNQDFGHR